ncbi:type II toxin-antitoxin system HipA family toxin [Demequina sp. SO4-18]|uniref:type II toxin-antitoxin system HipA family toxin n=1 Tax=Demequina sp. SO4-18 TaxID=3401026 RepID=UPI003B58E676
MAQGLLVELYGAVIGRVMQDDFGRRSFEYDPGYASDASRPPLSLSMPVSGVRYRAKTVTPFLWGLLPDSEDVRERWAEDFGVSAENPFALLSHMGRDCAGGAKFLPEGGPTRESSTVELSDSDIGARLRDLRSSASEWAVAGERWSLAGAQSKFTLSRTVDGAWMDVDGDEPSTHIFKPGVSEYRHQALVEHVSMATARQLGLRAAKTEFRAFGGESALVVTRFDRRRRRDGTLVRVHQEDMCQALAVYPRKKYEASGGPSAAAIARVLRDNASDPERDVWEFAQALVFNYLIGAPDAHAKNYSVTLAPGRVGLAPLYDVASALPYDAVGDSEINQAAMSIGGRRVFGTVHGRHWDRLATGIGVDTGRLRDEIHRQAARIPLEIFHGVDPFDEPDLRDRWTERIRFLCEATVTQLRD